MADMLTQEQRDALEFDPFEAMQGQDASAAPQPQAPQAPQQPGPMAEPPVAGQPQPQAPVAPAPSGQQPQAPVAGAPAQQPANSVAAFMDAIGKGQMPPGLPQTVQVPLPPHYQHAQPQAPQQPQPQPQAPQAPAPVDYSKPYAQRPVTVPDNFMAAIFGEDPRAAAQAMNTLVGTLYNSILQEVHGQMGMMHSQLQAMPGSINEQVQMQNSQKALYDKFYGKHRELDTPAGRNMTTMIAANTLQAYQGMGVQVDIMSDEFLDYVANQARQAIGIAHPGTMPQKPQPRATQFSTGGAARAGGEQANPFADALGVTFG